MTLRWNSSKILVRKRLLDSIGSFSFSVFLTIVLLSITILCSEFISSVGTAGIEFDKSPVFGIIQKYLSSTFGEIIIVKLFARGPLELIYKVSLVLMIIYFSVFTLIEISGEMQSGAYEMLLYGPFNPAIYIVSSFISVIIGFIIVSIVTLLFSFTIAAVSNIFLDWKVLFIFINSLLLFSCIISFGLFIAAVVKKIASALLIFTITVSFLFIIQMIMVSALYGSAKKIISYPGIVVQWISPFFYFFQLSQGYEKGNGFMLFFACIAPIVFTLIFLTLSTISLRKRFE